MTDWDYTDTSSACLPTVILMQSRSISPLATGLDGRARFFTPFRMTEREALSMTSRRAPCILCQLALADHFLNEPPLHEIRVIECKLDLIVRRHTEETRMVMLDHRKGGQVATRCVLHQHKRVVEIERLGKGFNDFGRCQFMGNGPITKTVEPELEVL